MNPFDKLRAGPFNKLKETSNDEFRVTSECAFRHSAFDANSAADGVLRYSTRRQFFSRCGMGLGSMALASLLGESRLFGQVPEGPSSPQPSRQPMFQPRAKNIIYLFMAGGPSQLE